MGSLNLNSIFYIQLAAMNVSKASVFIKYNIYAEVHDQQ